MSDESAGTDGDKSGKAHFWAYRLNEYATNMAVEIDQRCPKEKSCLVRNDSSVRPRLPASSRGGTGSAGRIGPPTRQSGELPEQDRKPHQAAQWVKICA